MAGARVLDLTSPNGDTLSQTAFCDFQRFLHEHSGITLGDGKRYLVQSRLSQILPETGLGSLDALIEALVRGQLPEKVRSRIIDVMTTNETFWFRDRGHFELLKERLLADLSRQRFRPLRIWSAACSTGQEPYSIAITALEAVREGRLPRANLRIVGTDLSQQVLKTAAGTVYSDLSLSRGLPEAIRQRYFQPHANGWRLKPEVRALVRFQPFNLLKPCTALGRFDLIFCRNVLIYFTPETKRDILQRLAAALEPGGYLFLSSTETLAEPVAALQPLSLRGTWIYQRPA
ncbi:chemotaxis protein methyltransferase CheR [Methylomarinovum caldicuralii]|uniref:Chemotaxis protein methyltransferase n=1 Tax=Methylomarinovum caldicuralii TaxID=438856 RepID=A0AAU9CA47_9GAMM|nr:protein-glutamate O-methyltransferase CheR [Methylomarinovum caldicuralii]BCX82919.1 chemotaxis protein methyltransferase CheR [Methylomarinovum caldicuralii]